MTDESKEEEAREPAPPPEPEREPEPEPTPAPKPERPWKKWLFLAVPLVGLVEVIFQIKDASSAVAADDWARAKEIVANKVQPDDLVLFAPRWVDPIGRMRFGDEIITVAREARPDETRFPRALEVSVRGGRAKELEGWKLVGEESAGAITIRTLENPHPAQVIDDLVAHYPAGMKVFQNGAECPHNRGSGARTGGIGFGPAQPNERFACAGGGSVSLTVIAPLDYRPRRCFLAPPVGNNQPVRVRFLGVSFGSVLHGHHTIYVEAERKRRGSPVTLTFKVNERVIGSDIHNDGEGWKGFDMNTSDLAGQKADLDVDITAPSGPNDREAQRVYCFEADTR